MLALTRRTGQSARVGGTDDRSRIEQLCAIPEDFLATGLSLRRLFESRAPDLTDMPNLLVEIRDYLHGKPQLVQSWQQYSWNIRSVSSPWLSATIVGFFDGTSDLDIVDYADETSACANFICRTTVWILKGHRLDPTTLVARCDEDELQDVEAALGVTLPSELRDLYSRGNGRYRTDGQWWVVWPIERLVTDTTRAWRDGTLNRGLLAFGDDGTGNPFCVQLVDSSRVLLWGWIDGHPVSSMSMSEFIAAWIDAP